MSCIALILSDAVIEDFTFCGWEIFFVFCDELFRAFMKILTVSLSSRVTLCFAGGLLGMAFEGSMLRRRLYLYCPTLKYSAASSRLMLLAMMIPRKNPSASLFLLAEVKNIITTLQVKQILLPLTDPLGSPMELPLVQNFIRFFLTAQLLDSISNPGILEIQLGFVLLGC